MRYGSVCSGIEAATQAWHPLGWSPAFFSEIEAFPSAVLAHHYGSNMPGEPLAKNGIPNYGDFTKIGAEAGPIDLLVGGTPCQSFSVAGKRLGLDDPRGNLALEYLSLARRLRARWIVWENVPGVLSSHSGDEQAEEDEGDDGLESADFATFLSFVQECGYGFAYRVLDAQYIRVDDFARAVPQRRRRVFLVGYLGDWRRAAAVLLEPEGMRGDSAPRREAGQATPRASAQGVALRGRDGGATAELTGPISPALRCAGGGGDKVHVIAFNSREDPEVTWDRSGSISAGSPQSQAVAFAQNTRDEVRLFGGDGQTVGALAAEPGMKQQTYVATHEPIAWDEELNPQDGISGTIVRGGAGGRHDGVFHNWAVRRLMPIECERLQGFPDGFTNVPWRGKQAADGPRYKALGNSMAVNSMRWIGQRIDIMEKLIQAGELAV